MPLRRFRSLTFLALVLFALVAAPAIPVAHAQSQSLYWERYDVDIAVQENGDLRVTETQVINFTSGVFREGFAELSTYHTDGISDVSISENGEEYTSGSSSCCLDDQEFAVEREGDSVYVTWHMGRTQNETRTFVLAYTVAGAIRRYDQGNEFQWNAIQPGMRDFDIREATVTIHMPPGVPLSFADYLVPPEFNGVAMTIQPSADEETATFTANETIAPSQGVQVVAQFAPGTVGGSAPTWQADFDRRNAWDQTYKPLVNLGLLTLGLLTLFGGGGLLYAWWYLRGRDPKIDAVPEYINQPPADLPPGIAGVLVDERADLPDLMATMLDLARRGFLVIEESSEASALRLVSKEFSLKKVAGANLSQLNAYERLLYDKLLGSRDTVRFRDLNGNFFANLPMLQNKLYETAVQQGYFPASPQSVRSSYGCIGVFSLVALFTVGLFAVPVFAEYTSTLICPVLAGALLAIALMIMAPHMPAKTRKGAEAAALARAFKTYLMNLEKYADPKAVTDQFEKYLPWATVFGLEKSWINRFRQIPTTPMPGWYYPVGRPYLGRTAGLGAPGTLGTAGPIGAAGSPAGVQVPTLQGMSDSLTGGLQGMSDGLTSMLNSASRTFTAAPPPSTTSGGGGSFSGSSRSGGRSFSGGGRSGGSFRSSGGSGGGRRGFR
ncbi:MAG: DUF2207 domain-containing protein [Anaerolineales bacterium]|nr:DUF2207 domain-containing protein [Anaerolineales bacterium]